MAVAFTKEPGQENTNREQDEKGNLPWNSMVIPPALLNQTYIAGSEGDWDIGAEGEDGNESEDNDEEPKQSEKEIQNTPTPTPVQGKWRERESHSQESIINTK
jgi:hypothetical protein